MQPRHAELHEGEPFELSIEVTGTAPLSFQWLYEGRRLRGESGAQLKVSAAAVEATGRYTCVVRNVAGSDSSAAARVCVSSRCLLGLIRISGTSSSYAIYGAFERFSCLGGCDGNHVQVSCNFEVFDGAK